MQQQQSKHIQDNFMPIMTDENRTDAYIGTFHYGDASDMLELKEVRKMVRNMNRMLREEGKGSFQFYVKVQGRLGKDNPFSKLYNQESRSAGTYPAGGHAYQMIRLEHAQRVDAYIYRRRS